LNNSNAPSSPNPLRSTAAPALWPQQKTSERVRHNCNIVRAILLSLSYLIILAPHTGNSAMSSPPTLPPAAIAAALGTTHVNRGLHFEGAVLGFNLRFNSLTHFTLIAFHSIDYPPPCSALVHSSSGSVTIKIRFETPQFTSDTTGITWSKRSTLLSASVSAVAPSDFERRMRCNMRFSGE
jgi:hypothetical protein